MSGSNISHQSGVYGTKGNFSSSHFPGSRATFCFWIDSNGLLWIFGGYGFDSILTEGIIYFF